MRTGERPAMGTGERPATRTGERPSLGDRTTSRTTTRSAPAATFADAMTPAKKDGKSATAAETLVMPKAETSERPPMTRGGKTQEMPAARDGKSQTAAESSPEARDGRSVQDMDSPVGRGGTRVVRMNDVVPKGRAEGAQDGKDVRQARGGEEKTVIAKAPQKDNFGNTPTTNNRPALGTAQLKEPVLPMKDIIPAGLNRLPDQPAVAKRFASDLALLQQQVKPSSLPSTDRALRLWAFFTAYAQAAAGKESTPAGKELFDKVLKEHGFGELRDKKTGQDGLKVAKWVLESLTPGEAKARAGDAEMAPPPEQLLADTLKEAAGKQGAKTQDGTGKPESAQAQDGTPKAESELAQEGARKPENAQAQEGARKPENAKGQDAFRKADSAPPQEGARKSENAQASDAFRKPESTQSHEAPRRLEDSSRMDSTQSQDIKNSSLKEGPDRPAVDRPEVRAELARNPVLEQRPLILPKNPELERRQDDGSMVGSFEEAWKKLSGNLRLGPNMLWNVLHRSRNSPEDSALEKEKWNQLVFAAMLAFVGLMLLVILVVSL